jgi:hypothetical protein
VKEGVETPSVRKLRQSEVNLNKPTGAESNCFTSKIARNVKVLSKMVKPSISGTKYALEDWELCFT